LQKDKDENRLAEVSILQISVIMPIPGILVTIVVLIGTPCRLDEYDPAYKYCSEHHRDNSSRRKDFEFHFDSPSRM
jgi:hypothetical protein